MTYDVIVIGAGAVGLACARRLTGRKVLVLERHPRPGQETSSRNSGVIHAGIYYPPGSYKARLCLAGRELLYEWCRSHDVPHQNVGKFLVATCADEEPALQKLLARAHQNGALEVTSAPLVALDRGVRATACLWSPRTGIVDVHALMKSLLGEADYVWNTRVVAARRQADLWTLTTSENEQVSTTCVINAAGLDADEVAALAGFSHEQYFVKGNYFRMRHHHLQHLIYPVPPADLAGVGVHVTLELDGSAKLGPDVQPIDRTRDYSVDEARKQAFFDAASRYLQDLHIDDLSPDQAGIRPKVKSGDFIIEARDRWINLVGIESPGLTACLAIADHVKSLLP
jgi:L-2-hydroxyglutarate oxidase LhgO